MRLLVLGAGMQGSAAAFDLLQDPPHPEGQVGVSDL